MDAPEGLISLPEAARRLGINRGTLKNMIKRGELRAFRLSNYTIRIDPLELRRFLHEHQVATDTRADHAKRELRLVSTSTSRSE